MNKQIVNFFKVIAIISYLSYCSYSYGFLGENLGLDLYEKIDKGVNDLENRNYDYLISGNGKERYKEINRISAMEGASECLDSELTIKEIKDISNGDISKLGGKLNEKCLKDGNVSINGINTLQKNIKKIDGVYTNYAKYRTKQIYDISNIGIYSDGDVENSGFDLINDLKEIDKVIFTQDIRYEGENIKINDNFFNNFLKNKINNYKNNTNNLQNQALSQNLQNKLIQESNLNLSNNINIDSSNKNVCSMYDNKSGLNSNEKVNIIQNLNTKSNLDDLIYNSANNVPLSGNSSISPTGYSSANDNKRWGCDDIFCIKIGFKMYNQKLLGGGKTFSIEYILQKSNEHLKKFSSTSLIQSKMTSGHYELGLRDLDLSAIFHLGFQVISKPVPMLKLDKTDSKKRDKEDLFSYKNLLEEYYRNNGMEYSRANDLTKYKQETEKYKSLLDSEELGATAVPEKEKDRVNELELNAKKNEMVSKAVDKKILYKDMQNFYTQFEELERFSKSILDYTDTMKSIIIEMKKIPVHN